LCERRQRVQEEYFEAARLDGASEGQIYRHVAMPLSTAILSIVGLLAFLSVWNDFIWPLLVIQDRAKFTLMLGLTYFSGESQILYGPLTAGYLLAAVPSALIVLAMRRTFIEGVLVGGLK